jgi:hypothetical protein
MIYESYFNAILAESMNHSEDFVLHHSVIVSPAERSVTRLSVGVLPVAVERMGKGRATVVIRVTFVSNINIVATPESRSVTCIVVNGLRIAGDGHLLLQVQRQQKSAVRVVRRITTFAFPRVWSVRSDGLAELCANESESVGNAVAFLVEFGNTKFVLRCSEQKLKFFGFVERLFYKLLLLFENFNILHDFEWRQILDNL